ncbi:unnamed protein product, partial [Tetraodon nigroviridis]
SLWECCRGLNWRADLPLSICATTCWPWPGTSLLWSSPTGTCPTCAATARYPTALCLRAEPDVATVSVPLHRPLMQTTGEEGYWICTSVPVCTSVSPRFPTQQPPKMDQMQWRT